MTEDPKAGGESRRSSADRTTSAKPAGAKASPAKTPAAGERQGTDPATLRLIAAAVVSLLVGLLLGALLFGGDGDEGDDVVAASAPTETQILAPEELAAEAIALGRPVYWAGPQEDAAIELTRTEEGNTSIRYIPEGDDGGGDPADYLTVVTYPYPDAYEALNQQAETTDVLSRDLPKGGFAISPPDPPVNAYLAYKGEDYQVEVYDPSPGRALKLVVDGAIVNAAG